MSLTVDEITENVFLVEADTQYELTSTFMRVQEFYESPFNGIRGQFFTHEKLMDALTYKSDRSATEDPVFSYLEDWAGFNVPGNVFDKWCKLFPHDTRWKKERRLVNKITEVSKDRKRFYVIGTYLSRDLDHELSHAWYYLDPKYKKTMTELVDKLSRKAKDQLKEYIIKEGYHASVVPDEMVAYLATSKMKHTAEMFGKVPVPWSKIYNIQKAFYEFKEEKEVDKDY